MRKERKNCIYCGKEVEAYTIDWVYRCPKCHRLYDITQLETIYECTGYQCGALFARSETSFPANQCPICKWPYGRIYANHVCPTCYSDHSYVNVCQKGKIVLCPECGKWFFIEGE